jgi:hypothetical protein
MKCNATQTGWEPDSNCGRDFPKTPFCDPDLRECVECIHGNKKCQGTSLVTCTNKDVWGSPTDCGTEFNPQGCLTDSDTEAHCVNCNESTFVPVCSDGKLRTCNVDQIVTTACTCIDATTTTPAHCL